MSVWPDSTSTWIMGILNVTPDSFSDGGQFTDVSSAVEHARRMIDECAHIIDVGGESTRPGSGAVPEDEQIRRIVPVIEKIRATWSGPISVDTTRARVAEAAFEAGANWINDISALRGDPAMTRFAAEASCPIILMHMRGEPSTMQENPEYKNVLKEVSEFLTERAQFAVTQGIGQDQIIIDPGIGFGKTIEHNLALLDGIPTLASLGYRLLIGASRKSFIGQLTGASVGDRVEGSLVVAVHAVQSGASLVRVHDVGPTRRALAMAKALSLP